MQCVSIGKLSNLELHLNKLHNGWFGFKNDEWRGKLR